MPRCSNRTCVPCSATVLAQPCHARDVLRCQRCLAARTRRCFCVAISPLIDRHDATPRNKLLRTMWHPLRCIELRARDRSRQHCRQHRRPRQPWRSASRLAALNMSCRDQVLAKSAFIHASHPRRMPCCMQQASAARSEAARCKPRRHVTSHLASLWKAARRMSACTAVASRSLCEFSFSRRANAFERQRLLIVVTPRRCSAQCADARRVFLTQLDQPRVSNLLRNRAVEGGRP